MRTDSAILADLDRLRDSRGTIPEEQCHLAWDRLWEELREHDRRLRQGAQEDEQRKKEQAQAERRNKRLAQAQRRLEGWLAQPTPSSAAALRARLEEFLRIPATNNPELRRRQAQIKARLNRPTPTPVRVQRPSLSDEERLVRRATQSGDKDKALEIARRYHRNFQRLFRSKYASIEYGSGGQEKVTWPRRYRPDRTNYPRVWKDGGVWIDYSTQPPTIVLEDYRGQAVCRLQVPLERVTFEGLEDGDLWGIEHGSRVERWSMGHAFPVVVGYVG